MFSYQKSKSVAKAIQVNGPELQALVGRTMALFAKIVGATLGPGGRPVLIERQEFNLPAMITKDGVTVARSLGLKDPTAHVILESARDAAVRTAQEAGDGTTTATVLAEAIVRLMQDFCQRNPSVSPQKVIRTLEDTFRTVVEPAIQEATIGVALADIPVVGPAAAELTGRQLLRGVAAVSANGETALADAVLECFDLIGDEGNVTLVEMSGPSHYEVERIDGFPVPMGYEDSCGKSAPMFINDQGNQLCRLQNPAVIMYFGRLNDMGPIYNILKKIDASWQDDGTRHEILVVATGFSEDVLYQFGVNTSNAGTIKIFPLQIPMFPTPNGQLDFLVDLQALVGGDIFDQRQLPLENAEIANLGYGVAGFEAQRWRSNFILAMDDQAIADREEAVAKRVEELDVQIEGAASDMDRQLLQERKGKLTGGIAKLKIIGASAGELREKRDRAEDAICAVRGALKHGCLPGAGWMLLRLNVLLAKENPQPGDPIEEVLRPALLEPLRVILTNVGMTPAEILDTTAKYVAVGPPWGARVYDALLGQPVEAVSTGLLDSTPAVREALRTALSIASRLGSLGGTVCYPRDLEVERQEARDSQDWLRSTSENPANERG